MSSFAQPTWFRTTKITSSMSVCSSMINLNISKGPSALYPATFTTGHFNQYRHYPRSIKRNGIDTYNNTWAVEMHFINFFEFNFGEISHRWHFLIDETKINFQLVSENNIFEAIHITLLIQMRVTNSDWPCFGLRIKFVFIFFTLSFRLPLERSSKR